MVLLAALLALASLTVAVPAAAAVPALTNPTFAQVDANGFPVGWSRWAPAGTARVTVHQTGGPDGGPALAISSVSGADARLALTQRLPVAAGTPRELTVTARVRGDGLSGGFSMIRVQAWAADGRNVLPAARGPYLSGTFDWRTYSASVVLPAEATQISVEPMLDRAAGTLWFADLELAETVEGPTLTASATGTGTTELFWSLGERAPRVARYAVHRVPGSAEVVPAPANLLDHAQAATTADEDVLPGTTYSYRVVGLDAAGQPVASTPSATVTTPEQFTIQQRVVTLTALQRDDGAHVSWSLPPQLDHGGLSLVVGSSTTPLPGRRGATTLAAGPGTLVRMVRGEELLASAVVGRSEHPRAVMDTDTVQDVRDRLAAGDPTATGAWQALLDRLARGDAAYPTNGSAGLYRGRDAAFAYVVTGDRGYAQQAHAAVMSAEGFVVAREINTGLELGRANLLLAPVYDWAYQGWDEEQRRQVRDLMTRSVDLLSTYHHDGLDDVEKTSNWVGVARTTELALLLSARGDGDFGLHDRRIAYLTDQVAQHLDQGYSGTGWTQEGWDYLHYTALYMLPSLYFAQGTGLQVLDEHLARPRFWELALHVASSREDGDVAQFGVSGPSGQVSGIFPLLFPLTPGGALPALQHTYDAVQGTAAPSPRFDDVHSLWSVLYHPGGSGDPDEATEPSLGRALLDDEPGFFAFRNRIADADDTLVVTSNRGTQHRGWSAAETFSLSWMSHDTTWAQQGGKASTDPSLWSKPLVDGRLEPYRNQYETVTGAGRTLSSTAFAGQGGGHLELDGSANFGVDVARREQVVDLAAGHRADALVVVHDRFADDTSHRWDWQLRPEPGVEIGVPAEPGPNQPDFTFTSAGGAVLSGFVVSPAGLRPQVVDGALRLSTTGTSADFRVVLATSAEGPLTSTTTAGGELVVDGRVVDFEALGTGDPLPLTVPEDDATAAPGEGRLSADEGWDTGLSDGSYTVTMDLWRGEPGSLLRLYENGALLAARRLDPEQAVPQRVRVAVAGRPDGRYTYTAELVNGAGRTPTRPVTVEVADAAPGRPDLRTDHRRGASSHTLTADLWWGTNGEDWRLREDGVVIRSGRLTADSPRAQRVQVALDGLAPGRHVYRFELLNAAGVTSSEPLTVEVAG